MKYHTITCSILLMLSLLTVEAQEINLIENAQQGFQLKELGPNVNTGIIEAIPLISPSGKTLYFIRSNKGSDEEIWYSKMDENGNWQEAQDIEAPLNNGRNNGVLYISGDENEMIVFGRYDETGGFAGNGISFTQRTADGWSIPRDITIKNYRTTNKSYNNFTFSLNREVVIMSLEREDSEGLQDLYISFREDDLTYSEPQHMGNILNTSGTECSPFLAADGSTLYFSSGGHPGYGKNDVFISRRGDDWLDWSVPQNLGPEVNSKEWEGFYTVPSQGDMAYLTRSKSMENKKRNKNIFRIPVAPNARPEPTLLLQGKVEIPDNADISKLKLYIEDFPWNTYNLTSDVNQQDSTYQLILPGGKRYKVTAIARDFRENELGRTIMQLDLTRMFDPQSEEYELNIETSKQYQVLMPPHGGNIIVEEIKEIPDATPSPGPTRGNEEPSSIKNFAPIHFDFAMANLRPESEVMLESIAGTMKDNPKLNLRISGHTDYIGEFDYNEKLGMWRAQAAMKFLEQHGIESVRIITLSFGERVPVSDEDTEEGRQRNRRVEFELLDGE